VAAGDVNTDGTGIESGGDRTVLDREQVIAPGGLAGGPETQFQGTSQEGTGIRSVGDRTILDREQAIAPDGLAGGLESQFTGESQEGTGIRSVGPGSMLTGERYEVFGDDDGPSTLLAQFDATAGHPVGGDSLEFHEVNWSSGDDDAPEFEADVIDDVDI
jgi:hypothetical protein